MNITIAMFWTRSYPDAFHTKDKKYDKVPLYHGINLLLSKLRFMQY